ncbi:hypothetical protein LUZ60_006527 [Juncus effusus]|nr:hypothetical protein LUZ60_006527 [Juncus effusus]
MVKSMEENNKMKEIMARYRPIAPMPPLSVAPLSDEASSLMRLQSRPCRGRKRGRPALSSLQIGKRPKPFYPLIPSTSIHSTSLTTRPQSFVHVPQMPVSIHVPISMHAPVSNGHMQVSTRIPVSADGSTLAPSICTTTTSKDRDLLTLSLHPYSSPEIERPLPIPVEKDLLKKLQEPKVIVPQPMRPVHSSIIVGCISPVTNSLPFGPNSKKLAEEVEEDVEIEPLPAVISDSHNKVRLTNSAYQEMVGQPECEWLETIGKDACKSTTVSNRINGGVKLSVPQSVVPKTSNGFSCRVKIEWARDGMRNYVCAPCDVRRLYCESRDYVLTWRFHTNEGCLSSCKA